jgi:hypothetical protein
MSLRQDSQQHGLKKSFPPPLGTLQILAKLSIILISRFQYSEIEFAYSLDFETSQLPESSIPT